MTLEEYEKVLEERRKAFHALKTEERKVDTKVFESMQQLSNKKDIDDIFIKLVRLMALCLNSTLVLHIKFVLLILDVCLIWIVYLKGSDKDKRRETLEKEDKSKKV